LIINLERKVTPLKIACESKHQVSNFADILDSIFCQVLDRKLTVLGDTLEFAE